MSLFNFAAMGGVKPLSQNMAAAKDARGLIPTPPTEKLSPTAQRPERGGLMGFLDRNRGQGNFVERLNLFGAELQDISDGGSRAEALRQRNEQALAQQQAMQQRMEINKLAQGMNLSPADQLLFNANPESFLEVLVDRDNDAREAAAKFNEVDYLNTSQGVYRTGPNPGWQERFEPDPLEAELMRARIAATQAQVEQRNAAAAKSRRPPAVRSSGGGSRSAAPSRAPWERF